jgi:hypothetical protein
VCGSSWMYCCNFTIGCVSVLRTRWGRGRGLGQGRFFCVLYANVCGHTVCGLSQKPRLPYLCVCNLNITAPLCTLHFLVRVRSEGVVLARYPVIESMIKNRQIAVLQHGCKKNSAACVGLCASVLTLTCSSLFYVHDVLMYLAKSGRHSVCSRPFVSTLLVPF